MDHSLLNISQNVIEILLKQYKRNENDLLNVVSSSPKTSVLRVNLSHPKAGQAVEQLQEYLQHLPKQRKYVVTPHPLLGDVLLVNSENDGVHPAYEKEVIVDTSCGSAVLRGADIFAPGVLAANPGMQRGDAVSVYVDLEKKCRRGLVKQFDGKKYFLGNGLALYGRQELFENNAHLKGTAIEMTDCRCPHPSFSNLDTSIFFPQNLPSILVGHIMKPQDGDIVLDMCASPGGKTTHMATLLNKGKVVAIDKTQKKVDRIVANCNNLGLTNVDTYCYDSTELLNEQCELGSSTRTSSPGPPFLAESFDKILLDPPCSGLGQRPQLHYVMKDKELQSYPVYQRKLLKQAIPLLKRKGLLVYSTCTLLPEENEEQVAWLLKNFPEMKLASQTPRIGRPGLPVHGLTPEECEMVQRFDWWYVSSDDQSLTPCTEDQLKTERIRSCHRDTIGFFIAKFIKM